MNPHNDTIFGDPTVEDLYRWDGSGDRTLSANCATPTAAYFSYGPATGTVAQFNNNCDGGDFGDWALSGTPQTQDAFVTQGSDPTLGVAEIDALTAIGYQLASPEPGTWLLSLVSLVLVGLAKRRLTS